MLPQGVAIGLCHHRSYFSVFQAKILRSMSEATCLSSDKPPTLKSLITLIAFLSYQLNILRRPPTFPQLSLPAQTELPTSC